MQETANRVETVIAVVLAAGAGGMALVEEVFRSAVWETWPARLAVLALLIMSAAWDWRTSLVPRWAIWPLLAAAAGRAAVGLNVAGLATLVVVLWDLRPADRRGEATLHLALVGVAVGASIVTREDMPLLTTLTWLAMYRMWRANWLGGGDAMLITGLVGLYPATDVLIAIGTGWLVAGLVQMARVYGHAFVPALYHALVRTTSPRPVPREYLEAEGVPMAAGIALGWGLAMLAEYAAGGPL